MVLLGPDRLFKDGPAALGMRFAFLREVRRAVAGEVKAQVEAFLATGLPLTYMDAHHHLHIHPGLFPLLLREGKPRGLRGIRVPVEPWSVSGPLCRPTPLTQLTRMVFGCLGRRCMHRARALDLITADGVFGLYATGRIGRTWVLGLLERLRGRQGLFELYTHPSYASDQGRQELRALTDRAVRTRLRETGIRLGSYTKA